ncbi:hypothetical protein ACIBQX_28065 [Nonomuraea sp. NPDC049714]|uniref:hypothetical protein n=1 Tax=Nonomuraea sp. NPDC049714 TaxID=3364357 RepID=UPI0037940376
MTKKRRTKRRSRFRPLLLFAEYVLSIAAMAAITITYIKWREPEPSYLFTLSMIAITTLSFSFTFWMGFPGERFHLRIRLNRAASKAKPAKGSALPGIDLSYLAEDPHTSKAAVEVATGLNDLFLRLGPPPPELRVDSVPHGRGDGGNQQ